MSIAENLIGIFLLIGLAHWASHIIECDGCRRHAFGFVTVLLEGVIQTFGWPIFAAKYVFRLFKPEPEVPESLFPDGEKVAGVLTIERREGESFDDFIERANREAIAKMTAEMKKAEKDGSK